MRWLGIFARSQSGAVAQGAGPQSAIENGAGAQTEGGVMLASRSAQMDNWLRDRALQRRWVRNAKSPEADFQEWMRSKEQSRSANAGRP